MRRKPLRVEDHAAMLRALGPSPDLGEDLPRRPETRGDCPTGPCPYVSCRHHLALHVHERTGHIHWTWPGLELDELPATCVLDVVASYGDRHMENRDIGLMLGRGQGTPTLILQSAMRKMRKGFGVDVEESDRTSWDEYVWRCKERVRTTTLRVLRVIRRRGEVAQADLPLAAGVSASVMRTSCNSLQASGLITLGGEKWYRTYTAVQPWPEVPEWLSRPTPRQDAG